MIISIRNAFHSNVDSFGAINNEFMVAFGGASHGCGETIFIALIKIQKTIRYISINSSEYERDAITLCALPIETFVLPSVISTLSRSVIKVLVSY